MGLPLVWGSMTSQANSGGGGGDQECAHSGASCLPACVVMHFRVPCGVRRSFHYIISIYILLYTVYVYIHSDELNI